MGSFHLIDGAKVTIFYPGLRKTCGRCHETAALCVGGGIAKVCHEKGGSKVQLLNKMLSHWKEIGFEPTNFKACDDSEDISINEESHFSPVRQNPSEGLTKDRLRGGVIIKKQENLGQSPK